VSDDFSSYYVAIFLMYLIKLILVTSVNAMLLLLLLLLLMQLAEEENDRVSLSDESAPEDVEPKLLRKQLLEVSGIFCRHQILVSV